MAAFRLFLILGFILFANTNQITANTSDDSLSDKRTTNDYHWDKVSINMGGFLTGLNNNLVLGSKELGLGIALDLEDALGLKSSIFVFRSEAELIYGKRNKHSVRVGYLGFFRSSTKINESEFEIGGEVYPIGTQIQSRFDLQIIRGIYNYSFFSDERIRLGASIGLFVMPINFSLEAGSSRTTAADFIAPLPVVGIDANFAITPKLYLRQSLEFLYIQFDGFSGGINDVNFRLEYNIRKHFGLGIGYNSYQLTLRVPKDSVTNLDFVGDIRSGYTGLLLYGKLRF